MAKQRKISENSARGSREEDLRRLAKWNDKLHSYGEEQDWDKKDKAEIIDYLQCQLIVSTSGGWG